MEKKIISSTSAPRVIGPYSQAVESGGLTFFSGQIPLDPATGNLVEGGIKAQTERALLNLGALLKENGMGFGNVLKTTVFMTDLGEFSEMNKVYAGFFSEKHPARSTIQVAALPKGAKVEIEATAAK